MTANEIIKAWEKVLAIGDAPIGEHWCCSVTTKLAKDTCDMLNRLQKENDDLFFKLNGVMWSVDKWLDGKELEQDEVNRAITMREKTLQITEKLQAEIEKWEKKGEFIVSKCDDILLNIEKHNQQFLKCIASVKSEARKEFAERLKKKQFTLTDRLWVIWEVIKSKDIDNLLKEMEGENP